MCGRYTFYDTKSLSERFETGNDLDLEPIYNAAPGANLPVIIPLNGSQHAAVLRWGHKPSWAKGSSTLINTRIESLPKPYFRKALKVGSRCLIPANGFFEWDRNKSPYLFHADDQKVFSMAGLILGNDQDRGFTIITKPAHPGISHIHNRMPLILSKESEKYWLYNASLDQEKNIFTLNQLKPETLSFVRVSPLVNRVSNQSAEVIRPL